MAIQIVRNSDGNCIEFRGSTNPVYYNACLSAEVDAEFTNTLNVINDVATAASAQTIYEFYNIDYTEFRDASNNPFASATEARDYINSQGNVLVGDNTAYRGVWNASTNTPDISATTPTAGDFYFVSVEGTTTLGDSSEWKVHDRVIYSGTGWQRVKARQLIGASNRTVLLNTNTAIFADGEHADSDPLNRTPGWHYENTENNKINWYFFGDNQNVSYTLGDFDGFYAVIDFHNTTSEPYFTVYTTMQGDGSDGGVWYRSRINYSDPSTLTTALATGAAQTPPETKFLVHSAGMDVTGIEPTLTRISLGTDSSTTVGPQGNSEEIYLMALSTSSGRAAGSEEFVVEKVGYKLGDYAQEFQLSSPPTTGASTDDQQPSTIDFRIDATNTTILANDGKQYGVNSIHARSNGDGTIDILAVPSDQVIYEDLAFGNITVNDGPAYNSEAATANALNSLFEVSPLGQGGDYAPTYPTLTGVEVTGTNAEGTTPTTTKSDGTTLHYLTTGGDTGGHGSRFWSTETIDTAGEYFTVKITGNGRFIIGFADDGSDDLTELAANSGTSHSGLIWSQAFYDYGGYTAPWTWYGSSSSGSYGPGWNGSSTVAMRYNEQVQDAISTANLSDGALFKAGIDSQGYLAVWYYDSGRSNDWILCSRRSRTTDGSNNYHLVVKLWNGNATLVELPERVAVDDAAPVLNYRYIESPDGTFYYPLFATEEEADYVDQQNGGSGSSHSHIFVDEPTNSTWYMPDTGGTHTGTSAPANTAEITYTEIATNADDLYAPAQFTGNDVTLDEGGTINLPINPADHVWTTSITISPALPGIVMDSQYLNLTGTAPQVAGNNVDNPSDTYTVTVTRSNAYGSSSGTFDLIVNNLTAPSTAATGFTWDNTSTTLVDANTMGDGSVVTLDDTLGEGRRVYFLQSWVEANILPNLTESGDAIWMGIKDGAGVLTDGVVAGDWDAYIKWEWASATSHTSTIGADTTSTVTINSLTDAFYDYAFENDGDGVHVIACNVNAINTEPAVDNGGGFSRTVEAAGVTGDLTISKVTVGTNAGLSTTDVAEIDIPYGANDIRVSEVSETEARFDVGSGPVTADNITLNAGYTYRFYLNNASIESGDTLTFETADGTPYTTGVSTVGTHGDYNYYVQFAVPSDVPPIHPVWNGTDQASIQISGSTYVTPVTGITLEGPAGNQTGSNLFDAPVGGSVEWGWLSIDDQLSAGQRLVLDNDFLVDLTAAMPNDSMVQIGIKDGTFSTNNRSNSYSNFEGGARFEIYRYSASDIRVIGYIASGNTISRNFGTNGISSSGVALAIEITNSGNNIRLMMRSTNTPFQNYNPSDDASATAYADWSSSYKTQTGDQGFGLTNVDVVILGDGQTVGNLDQADGPFNTADVDWTGLSEIPVPTPAATLTTSWTKALDFSGSSERTQQVNNSTLYTPLRMAGINNNVAAPTTAGYTSNDANARPWATAIVFNADGNSSNQHIWNLGEGAGSTDDNIYLRIDASRNLYFGWGRSGALNECHIGASLSTTDWYGVYVAHTGERLGGTYTAADIADCFDIRVFSAGTNWQAASATNASTANGWTSGSFGARMNREFTGVMTIGGRGSNRNFHGKVAAMVVTTLRRNVAMPTDAEISMMVRDPEQWLIDYKVGNSFRRPSVGTDDTNFQLNGYDESYGTQVWLMGDGTNDAYAQIRNQVFASEQNRTPMNMISMVSNDIVTVNINGLS